MNKVKVAFEIEGGVLMVTSEEVVWIREDDEGGVYLQLSDGTTHKVTEDITVWTTVCRLEGIDE